MWEHEDWNDTAPIPPLSGLAKNGDIGKKTAINYFLDLKISGGEHGGQGHWRTTVVRCELVGNL